MTVPKPVAVLDLDTEDARQFRHIPGLDGLRAWAVILVVLFHYGSLWAHGSDGGLFPGGFLGVDVFFVLSGFLITSLLVGERAKTGRVSIVRFYARRASRLMPALVLLLIGFSLYAHWQGGKLVPIVKADLSALFYLSNIAQIYFFKTMLHTQLNFTWSLAIEEQFYLVWPALLVFGILRYARTRTAVLTIIAIGVAASALSRLYLWNWGMGYPAAYMRLDARADGLLIGAFCAFLWRWRMVPRKYLNEAAWVCAAGLIGVTLVWPRLSGGMFQGGFTLVSLAVAVIVLAIAEGDWQLGPFMEWAPLRAIGRVSYGLYLWHGLMLHVAAKKFAGDGRVFIALVGLAMTAVVVLASWYFVEQPFLRLKDRLFASPVSH